MNKLTKKFILLLFTSLTYSLVFLGCDPKKVDLPKETVVSFQKAIKTQYSQLISLDAYLFGSTLQIKGEVAQPLTEEGCKIIINSSREFILNQSNINSKKYSNVEIEITYNNEEHYYFQSESPKINLKSWIISVRKADNSQNKIFEKYEIS